MTAAGPATARRLDPGGVACLVAGLVGAGLAALVAAAGRPTSDGAFTYPTALPDHTPAQMVLALAPVGLVVGLLALRRTGALPRTRRSTMALVVAVAALAALAVAEGTAISDPVSPPDATPPAFGLVHAGYTLVLGVALLSLGAELLRGRAWDGPKRWLPSALGAWLLVPGLVGLLLGHAPGAWARAVWFLGVAAVGLALLRSRPVARPGTVLEVGGLAARGYAAVTWVYAAAFGSPAVPVVAYLLQNDRLPSFFGAFETFGGPRFASLSTPAHVLVIVAFLAVALAAAVAAWGVRRGSRAAAVTALGVLLVEAGFWVVFEMPIPWGFAAFRLLLLGLAWRALDRGVGSTPGPQAVHPGSKVAGA